MKETKTALAIQQAQTLAALEVKGFENHLLAKTCPNKKIIPSYYFSNLTKSVRHYSFSNDGQTIYFHIENSLYLLNYKTGKFYREIPIGNKDICFTESPDGKLLVTSDGSSTITIQDLKTGAIQRKISFDHELPHYEKPKLTFSPDGKHLLQSESKTLVWDFNSGELLNTIETYSKEINISPDSKYLVYPALDCIKLFDLVTGQLIHRYPKSGPGHHIMIAKFCPSGRSIIFYRYETDFISYLDVRSGLIQKNIYFRTEGQFYSSSVQIVTDQNDQVLIVQCDSSIQVYKTDDGALTADFVGNYQHHSLTHNPQNDLFAVIEKQENSSVKNVLIWRMPKLTLLKKVSDCLPEKKFITETESGKIHFVTKNNEIKQWLLQQNQVTTIYQTPHRIKEASINQSINQIITDEADYPNHDFFVNFLDMSGKKITSLPMSALASSIPTFSEDHSMLAYYHLPPTGRDGGWVAVRDRLSGEMIADLHVKTVPRMIYFSSDNSKLITANHESFFIWDLNSGNSLERSVWHDNYFSNVDKLIISKKQNIAIFKRYNYYNDSMFNLNTMSKIRYLEGKHPLFIPPQDELYLSFRNGQVTIREVLTDKTTHHYPMQAPYDFISSDGTLAYTWNDGKVIQIFNTFTGEHLATNYGLDSGYLWMTPPDQFTDQGWIYTNRADLISFTALGDNPEDVEYLTENDPRVKDYLRVHNDRKMVMSKIFDPEEYQKLAKNRQIAQVETAKGLLEQTNQQVLKLLAAPAKDDLL